MNNTSSDHTVSAHRQASSCTLEIDGVARDASVGEPLVDVLNRVGRVIPQVCYHPQLGPIQTCDTCMVQVNGVLARACGTPVAAGMVVDTEAELVDIARREAFDRILGNHQLYCTVCDNNNENCTVHNTTALLDVKHQTAALSSQTLSRRQQQSLLSLRSRPVHFMRALRRGMPERTSERDAVYQLGIETSTRSVGWRRNHCGLKLRLLRPLRDGVPVQCAHGKIDDRPSRLLHWAACQDAQQHDRCCQRS